MLLISAGNSREHSILHLHCDVFPIGFMIAAGNEDCQTWVRMLTNQGQGDEGCADISQQGEGEGVDDDVLPKTSALNRATPFLFLSDRDKGLKEAVKEVFPANVEFSCAQHIRANVLACCRGLEKCFQIRYGNCQNVLGQVC